MIKNINVFCISVVLLITVSGASIAGTENIKNWLCYYGDTFGPDIYSRFDLVVLDGHKHPPLPEKGTPKPIILGYLSVGEVNVNSPLWPLAKGKSYLVKRNEFWDSWIVDIRSPMWQKLLFETAIPTILNEGFDGLFLDTFDSSLGLLTDQYENKYKGIKEALEEITGRIKREFPEKYVAVNRGLPSLPYIAKNIDIIVIENLFSYYAGHDKGYIRVDSNTQQILLDQVKKGLSIETKLSVLTLDYAGPEQHDMIIQAINNSRKRGFIPYVSTYELNKIYLYTLDE